MLHGASPGFCASPCKPGRPPPAPSGEVPGASWNRPLGSAGSSIAAGYALSCDRGRKAAGFSGAGERSGSLPLPELVDSVLEVGRRRLDIAPGRLNAIMTGQSGDFLQTDSSGQQIMAEGMPQDVARQVDPSRRSKPLDYLLQTLDGQRTALADPNRTRVSGVVDRLECLASLVIEGNLPELRSLAGADDQDPLALRDLDVRPDQGPPSPRPAGPC
jgi:hypothetical protein